MKEIYDDIKTLKGKVVCICVENDKILRLLSKNNDVDTFAINRIIKKSFFFRNKKLFMPDGKKVKIKKLGKTFKKKTVDYMICDYNAIEDYFKYIIGNTVDINKKKLYLYGTATFTDPRDIAKRFERYNTDVKLIVDNDDFVIIVNNENSKTSWIKNKWYFIKDTCQNIGDMISASLVS